MNVPKPPAARAGEDTRWRAATIGRLGVCLTVLLAVIAALGPARVGQAVATLPPGFQEQVVFSGLTNPTVLRFSPDGRVFVAEKSGLVKVFSSLSATTPTVFADLRTNVHNFWDRGLLGMTLDPSFPTVPYVYVLYTFDAAIGGTAPQWGSVGADSDGCPTPPGATTDGCVVSGRLSRLQAAGNVMTGSEQVLVEDWCQQYPSHSIGTLIFGADGKLYASGGDGASYNFVDYGQDGSPVNPCGDPPGGVGAALSPPTAEGGALRSQSLRRTGSRPVSLDGTIIRIDPATGAGPPDNPLASDPDANARRIVAYGLRNPFRITTRPGTNELWIGDVGWNDWEEINVIDNPVGPVKNFGWPCYEGNASGSLRQSAYDSANLNICETLYNQTGTVTAPFYAYHHSAQVVPNETCPTGSSSITGLAFVFNPGGGSYPSSYDGALFFADHSRNCIWVMSKDPADGKIKPSSVQTFVAGAANPVELVIGPGGDLYYVDFDGGTIRRIQYNSAPTAVIRAAPTSGAAPLTVSFDGTGSSDPNPGDTITYAWDLDGDGAYNDSTAAKPTYTYSQAGAYTVRLKVTDNHGASSVPATTTITVGSVPPANTPPTATIVAPVASLTWKVGDAVAFSGSATDQQDGTLPASALTWKLILHHCPSNCHTHDLQTFTGVASGSFNAPDHDYPSYLELQLTATDSGGLTGTASVRLDPKTVVLTFQTSPASGFQLVVGSTSQQAPFSRTVIVGSTNSISATSPQITKGQTYQFDSWSDGGAQTHTITAPAAATTYSAKYRKK
jgi:glucose/arabinose dehydrogenase